METSSAESVPSPALPAGTTDSQIRKWFSFRLRTLLIIPIALLLLGAYYVPRQISQRAVIAAFKKTQTPIRTQPIVIPWVAEVFGPEYAEEVIEVYLANASYSDKDLEHVDGLASLQKLELTNSSVTSEGLKRVARNRGLYTLHLSNTKIGDDGLTHLGGLQNLGILSLDGTQVSDSGLHHLEALRGLERLFLDNLPITDKGMELVGRLQNLKELSVTRTQITDVGADHIKNLVNLEVLKIYDTSVTRDKLFELAKSLPNCVFLTPDPGQ